MNQNGGSNFPIWVCVAVVVLVVAVRMRVVVSRKKERPGSVADLVRRGQLRSDRRGMYDFYPYPLILTLFAFTLSLVLCIFLPNMHIK